MKKGDRGTFPWEGDPNRPVECEVMSVGKPSLWNPFSVTVRFKHPDTGRVRRGLISPDKFTLVEEFQPVVDYCLGFAFDMSGCRVALLRKRRPSWMAGKLNGIGGKVEGSESPHDAMVREFQEETGLAVPEFLPFGVQDGKGYRIHLFAQMLPDLHQLRNTTDEVVAVAYVWDLAQSRSDLVAGIPALVFLALDRLNKPAGAEATNYRIDV